MKQYHIAAVDGAAVGAIADPSRLVLNNINQRKNVWMNRMDDRFGPVKRDGVLVVAVDEWSMAWRN